MNSIKTIYNFMDIDNHITNEHLDPSTTMIFIDIDNTMLRTKTDIGSVEWVRWQENLIDETNGYHKYCVAPTPLGMYKQYRKWLINSNCETETIDEVAVSLFDKYHKMGYKIILVTSRDQITANVTYQQLSRHYDINKLWTHDLYFKNEKVLFKNGVFFISGSMKGEFISYLLKIIKLTLDYEPQNIVFIDDTATECISVTQKFSSSNINTHVFNYIASQKYQEIFNNLDKDIIHNKWLKFSRS